MKTEPTKRFDPIPVVIAALVGILVTVLAMLQQFSGSEDIKPASTTLSETQNSNLHRASLEDSLATQNNRAEVSVESSSINKLLPSALICWASFRQAMQNDPITAKRWMSGKATGVLLLDEPWLSRLKIGEFDELPFDSRRPLPAALADYLARMAHLTGEDLLLKIQRDFPRTRSDEIWKLEMAALRHYSFSETERVASTLRNYLERYDEHNPAQVGSPNQVANAVIAVVLADSELFTEFASLPEHWAIQGSVKTTLVHSFICGIDFEVIEPDMLRWLNSEDRWLIFGVLEGLRALSSLERPEEERFPGEKLATLIPYTAIIALGEKLQVIYFELLEERAGRTGVLKLMELCNDENILARGKALSFLVMGGHVDLSFVQGFLANDFDDMHLEVVNSLARFLPDSYDDLWHLYQESSDKEAQARAFEVLLSTGELGMDEVTLAYEAGGELQVAAIAGIGWLERSQKGFHPNWRQIISDGREGVAWEASRQWLQNHSKDVFDVAIAMEQHPSPRISSLGFAQRHLALALTDDQLSAEQRELLETALSEYPIPDDIPELFGCASLEEANLLVSTATKEYLTSTEVIDLEELLEYLEL